MPMMTRSAGLYFAESDLQLARDNLDREPLRDALSLLDSQPPDPLEAAQLLALNYLFHHDARAGAAALDLLRAQDFGDLPSLDLPSMKRQLGWLSVMAMLREHPRWQSATEANLSMIGRRAPGILQSGGDACPLRLSWLAAVSMAAGILREEEASFQPAADIFRRLVDAHIHPEGYFKGIVDIDGAKETYAAQFSATSALVLMAEMAGQTGEDLWSYNNRAVSVNTAATYTYYYYFFPEGWKWESDLTREATMALMRREGAFFEMVNRRVSMRGIEQLFAEQRPMFSALGGGLTTLTHGLAPPKKRRWLLW